MGTIVADCKAMENHFSSLFYSHVSRMGNQIVHTLARYAVAHPNLIWIEEGPDVIENCILLDFGPSS